MIISIVAAVADNNVIGRGSGLPWRLPVDMKRFQDLTMGRSVIMGRKTFEGIGRPLPGRKNIVITRQADFRAEGCVTARSLKEAIDACRGEAEVFIAGGASVYAEAMQMADRIYLTRVRTVAAGDALFPPIPPEFTEKSRVSAEDVYPLEFIVYERKG
jgi:dihydrofolate reductase